MGFCMVSLCGIRHISSQCSGWVLKRGWKALYWSQGLWEPTFITFFLLRGPALATPWNRPLQLLTIRTWWPWQTYCTRAITQTSLCGPVEIRAACASRPVMGISKRRSWCSRFILHQPLYTWMLIPDFTSEREVSMKWRTNRITTAVIKTRAHNYKTIVPSITGTNVQGKVSFC
jgi:hypothetical protein